MIDLSWADFKTLISGRKGQVLCLALEKNYLCQYIESGAAFFCFVPRGTEDSNELEGSFLPAWNKPITSDVTTQLEKDDKTLCLASVETDVWVDDEAVLDIVVPGEAGGVGRYIKDGYAFTNVFVWGTRLISAALIDHTFIYAGQLYPATPLEAGIPGTEGLSWADIMPSGVVLGDYCDVALDAQYIGWRIWCERAAKEDAR